MNRIIVVSELFYPDSTSTAHILTKIADHLSVDHDILVLAGPELYSSDKVQVLGPNKKPYGIKRITIGNYDKNKLLSRTLRLFVTSYKLGGLIWKNSTKDDIVLIVTNPAPLIILAAVLKKLRGFKLNILVHDVFPENTIPAGIVKSKKNFVYKFIKYIFSKAYKSADNIIVLGRDMREIFVEKFKKAKKKPVIKIIENWADPLPANFKPIQRNDKLIKILYAGNIGRCQGLEQFISIFEKASNPVLKFVMRGGGALTAEINRLLEHTNSNIVLEGSFFRDEQFDVLSNCDIALVTLADGMYGLGVPSKSYNIMAAGKPLLFIGDPNSEIALTIRERNLGYVFDTHDNVGLEAWLSNISGKYKADFEAKGINARNIASTDYSEKVILFKYSNLFSI